MPGADQMAGLIGAAEHLILVVADGLALSLVQELPSSSLLRRSLRTTLQTVFPSSSATALTSLVTGRWPAQHAVTGQWTHLPEIGGSADLLRFAARSGGVPLAKRGVSEEQAFPVISLLADIPRATLTLFPEPLHLTASSAYFSGHRPRRGYRVLSEAAAASINHIETADGPTFTYLYSPWIDGEVHWGGLQHHTVRAAVLDLERAMTEIVDRLGDRVRLVISADHGLLETPVAQRHWLKPGDPLLAGLQAPPSGDSRVMFLHVAIDERAAMRQRFRDRFGDRFCVIEAEEAIELELFGPERPNEVVRRRLGDLIVISTGVDILEYVPGGSIDRLMSIAAHHSGLSPAEMLVPLVVI